MGSQVILKQKPLNFLSFSLDKNGQFKFQIAELRLDFYITLKGQCRYFDQGVQR